MGQNWNITQNMLKVSREGIYITEKIFLKAKEVKTQQILQWAAVLKNEHYIQI